MEVLAGALWVVVSIAFLLSPLLSREATPLAERVPWLAIGDDEAENTTAGHEPSQGDTRSPRAVTDGGHRCYNCGAEMAPEYTYCGECLTPRP
jgi:hypothetical protein